MLGSIVNKVGLSWTSVVSKPFFVFSVPYPVKLHVHSFGLFHLILFVDYSDGRGSVVGLDRDGRLRRAHLFECVACRDVLF